MMKIYKKDTVAFITLKETLNYIMQIIILRPLQMMLDILYRVKSMFNYIVVPSVLDHKCFHSKLHYLTIVRV